jgi:predicted ABC-type ATPase
MKNVNRKNPVCYIIAGPNGAGKTTFARKFLPEYVKCLNFINADLIAGGISPFAPEKAAIQAGRIMIERIRNLSKKK